jgi:hypothetical protein
LRSSVHYDLLRFIGSLSVVKKLYAHVEAGEKFVDKTRDLIFSDLDDLHQPSKK